MIRRILASLLPQSNVKRLVGVDHLGNKYYEVEKGKKSLSRNIFVDVNRTGSSLCNMKKGRVRRFARLDYFARAMACNVDRFLSIVFHSCCQDL